VYVTCHFRCVNCHGLKTSKACNPHDFNTKENLEYVGPVPHKEYYGASKLARQKGRSFFEWYECQKGKRFDSKRVLELYYQDYVTVLRQKCQIFRREFMAIGNIEVILEAITFASSFNKVLRSGF
jgi:hypothetical protein